MLIIKAEFIDCLTALYSPSAPQELDRYLWNGYDTLFSWEQKPTSLTAEGSKALAALQILLRDLPVELQSKIPTVVSEQDKTRLFEFTWLWRKMHGDGANTISRIYHNCSLWDNCNTTLLSVAVRRNHPALVRLSITGDKPPALGKLTQSCSVLGRLFQTMIHDHQNPMYQEMLQVFVDTITNGALKILTADQLLLLEKALAVKYKPMIDAVLLRLSQHQDHTTHDLKRLINIVELASKQTADLQHAVIKGLNACILHYAEVPATLHTLMQIALLNKNKVLLDLTLEILVAKKFPIHFYAVEFAYAYAMGGVDLINILKAYQPDLQPLELVTRESDLSYREPIDPLVLLASGKYSTILQAMITANGQKKWVAVKSVTPQGQAHLENERLIYQKIANACRYIIQFYGLYLKKNGIDNLGLVLEYGQLGDLHSFREALVDPSDALLHQILFDAVKGLAYCHQQNIILNDGKPDNIVVELNKDGTLTAKHCDFNLSYIRDPGKNHPLWQAGTLRYMAPEKFVNTFYDIVDVAKCDIWSMACIMSFLVYAQSPWGKEFRDSNFESNTEITKFIDIHEHPAIPEDKQYNGLPSIARVMHLCFMKEPRERMSSDELVSKLEQVHHFRSI